MTPRCRWPQRPTSVPYLCYVSSWTTQWPPGPEPSPGSSVCVPVSPPWKGHSFEEQSEKDDVGSADVGKSGLVSDVVELVIPVDADLVVLARMTAATVASRANFDVEEIEDLRLAVDELCISLVQGGTDGRLEVRFTRNDDEVEVECVYHPIPSSQSGWNLEEALEGLSARILDALVDEHGVDDGGEHRRAWLRKQRARQQA